jgi:hypothetical protein
MNKKNTDENTDESENERKINIYFFPKLEGGAEVAGRILSDPRVAEGLNWVMEVVQGLA